MKRLILGLGVATAFVIGCGGGGGSSTGSATGSTTGGGSCSLQAYLPNYASSLEPGCQTGCSAALYRWGQFPVRISFLNRDSWTAAQQAAADGALNAWVNASGGLLSFTVDDANPQITLEFKPTVSTDTSVIGITNYTTQNSTMFSAAVKVSTTFLSRPRTDDDLRRTAVHELGHALGISGHSPAVEDVMFALIRDSSGTSIPLSPSTDDWNTLKTAYCGDFTTRTQSSRGLDFILVERTIECR